MTAYHHPRANHVRPMPAGSMRTFAVVDCALWACDATRVTTQASCSPTIRGEKRRDTKWEVDSKAEVNGS